VSFLHEDAVDVLCGFSFHQRFRSA
jgi:hypothetical protein